MWLKYVNTLTNYSKAAELDANNPATRSNDGRADPWGGFWIGTMGKEMGRGEGGIYRWYRGKLRKLYGDIFEYVPQFKVVLMTNHKPIIRGDDLAIWRRIRLIPFKVVIPEEKQLKGLIHQLFAELPGILNWALDGLRGQTVTA